MVLLPVVRDGLYIHFFLQEMETPLVEVEGD